MSKIYRYYLSSVKAIVTVSPDISFYNVSLTQLIPYCATDTMIRYIDGYNGNIANIEDHSIVLGMRIGKRRLNRQDLFTKVITLGYKNSRITLKYDFMYEHTLYDIISIICRELNVEHIMIELIDPIIKIYIVDTVIDTSSILEYIMTHNTVLFPRERNSVSKHNHAKLIHLTSVSKLSMTNTVTDSITISSRLNIPLKSNCVLISVKIHDVTTADKVICDIVEFTEYVSYLGQSLQLDTHKHISSVKHMRSIASDLFVQRYSRESSRYICVVSDEAASECEVLGYSILKYESRWYMSLVKNMYVGLKLNRLSSKDRYKYIPTLYKQDHSKISGTNTYNYVHNINAVDRVRGTSAYNSVRELRPWEVGQAPNCILNILSGDERDRCIRIGVPASISDMYSEPISDTMFNLVRQELGHISTDEIKDIWYSNSNWHQIPLLYRMLEELLDINVVIISNIGDHVEILSYDYITRYVWNSRDSDTLLLLRTNLDEYRLGYEIISLGEITVPRYSYLSRYSVSHKLSSSARYVSISDTVRTQYINSEGKCIAYENEYLDIISCYSAPVYADYIYTYSIGSHLHPHLTRENVGVHTCERSEFVRQCSYDNVVTICGIRLYVSEILPRSYIPRVILDNVNDAVISDDISNMYKIHIKILSDDSYRYYLAIDY